MKKWIAIVLLAGILCGMLAGCGKKVTAEEAWQVVRKDLGAAAELAETPHVHEATYEDKPCFNIFVTVDGLPLQYIISENGKILHKGPGEHSH
ncbi:MAG: hypothetical protein IKB80_03975 [Oscillospiraceae bacterium]|nr:hypothetical protein [Oscillospiraceae bacterium]